MDALISNVDYAPTLLSLCGVEAQRGMQGVNLNSLLTRGKGPSTFECQRSGSYDLLNSCALNPPLITPHGVGRQLFQSAAKDLSSDAMPLWTN